MGFHIILWVYVIVCDHKNEEEEEAAAQSHRVIVIRVGFRKLRVFSVV